MCGCQTGFACPSTPRFGVRKAPPDEAHTRSRFSLILYFRACAPGNVFRHGHGHVRAALTSPLGLLLDPGGPAPVRTCKLQSSAMAGKTQQRGGSSAWGAFRYASEKGPCIIYAVAAISTHSPHVLQRRHGEKALGEPLATNTKLCYCTRRLSNSGQLVTGNCP